MKTLTYIQTHTHTHVKIHSRLPSSQSSLSSSKSIEYWHRLLKGLSEDMKWNAGMITWPFPVELAVSSSESRTCSLIIVSDLEVCTCTVAISGIVTFTKYLKGEKIKIENK